MTPDRVKRVMPQLDAFSRSSAHASPQDVVMPYRVSVPPGSAQPGSAPSWLVGWPAGGR